MFTKTKHSKVARDHHYVSSSVWYGGKPWIGKNKKTVEKIQRLAAIGITEAFKSTPQEALEELLNH